MFGRRHRRSSSPAAPSHWALAAASSSHNPLAAAAAGAALRDKTVSPPPAEQCTGSIPTKRMLQRRDSYSSTASELPAGAMGKRGSSRSLTQRRFRSSPPASEGARNPPTSLLTSTGSMRETMRSPPPPSIRSAGSPRGSRRPQNHDGRSVLSRGSLRGEREPPRERRRFSTSSESSEGMTAAPAKQRPDGYAESHGSYASDFDSILEDDRRQSRRRRRSVPIREEEDEEERRRREDHDDIWRRKEEAKLRLRRVGEEEELERVKLRRRGEEATGRHHEETNVKIRREEEAKLRHMGDAEDEEERRAERRKTLALLEPPRVGQAEAAGAPRSPTRAHFSGATLEAQQHSPPPRSVSPAKSALKHPISEMVAGDTPSSAASEKRTQVRISFSDEDSSASHSHSRPPVVAAHEFGPSPAPPAFGGAKVKDAAAEMAVWRKRETALVESASPVAVSPGWGVNGNRRLIVPDVVLIEPTPMEEEKEDIAMSSVIEQSPAAPPEKSSPTQPLDRTQVCSVSPPLTPVPGAFPVSLGPTDADPPSDSDSSSIYEDALEEVAPTVRPTMNPLSIATAIPFSPSAPPQSTTSSPPLSPRQTNAGNRTPIPRPPSPPLPASFSRPTPTPSRRRSLTPPPRRRPSQRQPPQPTHASDSDAASVSSFRRAHPRSTGGFRSSMRTGPPSAPARRFSEDSSDDEVGRVRRRFGFGFGGGGGGGRDGAAWRSRYEDSSGDEREASPVTARTSVRLAATASSPGKLRRNGLKTTPAPPVHGDVEETKKKGLFGFLGKKDGSKRDPANRSNTAALDVAFSAGDGAARKRKKRWWKFGH